MALRYLLCTACVCLTLNYNRCVAIRVCIADDAYNIREREDDANNMMIL